MVCVPLGTWLGARAGFSAGKSFAAFLAFPALILLGAKLLYLAEASLFPVDDYVPVKHRGPLHGFRIPGGIVLLAMLGPLISRGLGLPWKRFGDVVIVAAPIALVGIRLGCFLNGCCFGKPSRVPWAISFPEGSLAFAYQVERGIIQAGSNWSLPVHPLQLYLAFAALVIAISVDENHFIRVVYYKRVDIVTDRFNVYEIFSGDAGNSWSAPTKINDVGPIDAQGETFIGDYIGLDTKIERHPGWADSRATTGGDFDVYSAVVGGC